MRSGKVVLGVVVGAAASVILGLLFAPARGSATRKRMARKVTDFAEDVQENLNDYIDATGEEYEAIKGGAMDLVNKGKKKAASVARTIHAK